MIDNSDGPFTIVVSLGDFPIHCPVGQENDRETSFQIAVPLLTIGTAGVNHIVFRDVVGLGSVFHARKGRVGQRVGFRELGLFDVRYLSV
ncbi:MAG: hypothetical protein ACYSWW_24160, partial [Planctomycetota bacterium]